MSEIQISGGEGRISIDQTVQVPLSANGCHIEHYLVPSSLDTKR